MTYIKNAEGVLRSEHCRSSFDFQVWHLAPGVLSNLHRSEFHISKAGLHKIDGALTLFAILVLAWIKLETSIFSHLFQLYTRNAWVVGSLCGIAFVGHIGGQL